MTHRNNPGKRSVKPDIPLAKETLKIARDELKGAKALYDTGIYPMAVFSLQQSMEKGWKSFGFYYGIINEEDARSKDIGHKGSRVCNKSIRLLQRIVSRIRSNIQRMRNFYHIRFSEQESKGDILINLESNIAQLSTELTNFANDERKYRNLSSEEMNKTIQELTLILKAFEETEKILNSPNFSEEHYEKIKEGAFEIGQSIFRGLPQAEDALKKICFESLTNEKIKKIIDNTIKGVAVITPLLCLAVLTQAHEQSTRYIFDGQSPNQIYTASHPLIQKFPEILQIAEKTLENLESFYETLPSGGSHP